MKYFAFLRLFPAAGYHRLKLSRTDAQQNTGLLNEIPILQTVHKIRQDRVVLQKVSDVFWSVVALIFILLTILAMELGAAQSSTTWNLY